MKSAPTKLESHIGLTVQIDLWLGLCLRYEPFYPEMCFFISFTTVSAGVLNMK